MPFILHSGRRKAAINETCMAPTEPAQEKPVSSSQGSAGALHTSRTQSCLTRHVKIRKARTNGAANTDQANQWRKTKIVILGGAKAKHSYPYKLQTEIE
jgi:hypothetical protein